MQSIICDDRAAHTSGKDDLRGEGEPGKFLQQRHSKVQFDIPCWSSVITIMPFFQPRQLVPQRQSQPVMLEADRLAYNRRIEIIRPTEYPMLNGVTYLDHGGTTLASRSLLDSFCAQMRSSILSNPHSDGSKPSFSAVMVEQTRQKVLRLFDADPEQWDVVFTANATAAIKLVMECFAGHEEGFDYLYHHNAHTSLVGVREQSHNSHCLATLEETEYWLSGGHLLPKEESPNRPILFAYPAQSNMNGERLPLSWPSRIRGSAHHHNAYTLLDAAALVSTSPLDLSNHATAPDFVAMSFYKIFGFPDLGALLVRKASAHILQRRKYFGGGTTEMVGCIGTSWVERKEKSVHARLEDGTIAIRSILALSCAIDTHRNLFDGFAQVSEHTGWLAKRLYNRLASLKHANGTPVCHLYKAPMSTYGDSKTQGATVTFNIRKSDGSWRSGLEVGALLRANDIHVRTGSLCNPAGMAGALGLSSKDLRAAFESGFRCNQPGDDVRGDVPFGMIRATVGAMSTLGDVENLANFIERHLVEHALKTPQVLDGPQMGAPEDSSFTTASVIDEKIVMETAPPSSVRTNEKTRPGPRRNPWMALFGCLSRRK